MPAASLDQLIALNEEIRALVRSGLPLEQGLRRGALAMPSAASQAAQQLGERLSAGQSLIEAMQADENAFPPVYRAVVEAGLRSGNLGGALDGAANMARNVAAMRRLIARAMLYPLLLILVLAAAVGLFVAYIGPSILEGERSLRIVPSPLLRFLENFQSVAILASASVAALVLAVALLWWLRSGRSAMLHPDRAARAFTAVPGIGAFLRNSQRVVVCDLLALLIEHGTPLPQAIRLAASAAGDDALMADGNKLEASLTAGKPLLAGESSRLFPPLVAWMLSGRLPSGQLFRALRRSTEVYRSKARAQFDYLNHFAPVVATVLIGGFLVLLYSLLLFGPESDMLQQLGGPKSR